MQQHKTSYETNEEAILYMKCVDLKTQIKPLQIPPNLTQLEEYRIATSSGYVRSDAHPDREPISLFIKKNDKLRLCDHVQKFSQMGYGYTYIFVLAKFLILLGFFPILVYAIALMIYNSTGNDCVSQEKYNFLRENVRNYGDLPLLIEQLPYSPVPLKLQEFYNSPKPNPILRKFVSLNCILNSSSTRCDYMSNNNCRKDYTKACELVNIDLLVDNFVTQQCRRDYLSVISAGNSWTKLAASSLWIDICDGLFLLALFLAILAFHYYHEISNAKIHLSDPRIEDYTVLVRNLQEIYIDDLPEKLKETFAELGFQVTAVNLCFKTGKYRSLVKDYNSILSKESITRYKLSHGLVNDEDTVDQDNNPFFGSRFEPTPALRHQHNYMARMETKHRKEDVKIKIREIEQSFREGARSKYFLGSAYVSFETIQQKNEVYKRFQPKSWITADMDMNNSPFTSKKEVLIMNANGLMRPLRINKAYSPHDIVWSNLGFTIHSRKYQEALTMILTIAITAVNFVVIFFLKFWAANLILNGQANRRNSSSGVEWTINFLLGLVVLSANSGMRQGIRELIRLERHSSYHSQDRTKIRKLWRAQFINKGVLIAVAALCLLDFYGPNGFIYTIFSIMITYMVMTPLTFPFLQCMMLYRLWMKRKITKFIEGRSPGPVKTMQQAFQYWLKPNFKMASCGNRFIRNFGFCLFVLPIFPFIAVLYLVLAIEFYWIAKFILVKRTNKVIGYSSRLTRKLTDELVLALSLFVIGIMLRDSVYNYVNLNTFSLRWYHIILLITVLLLYLLKGFNIVKLFLPERVYSSDTYFETIRRDPNTYYMKNPAYVKEDVFAKEEGHGHMIDDISYPVIRHDPVYEEMENNTNQYRELY